MHPGAPPEEELPPGRPEIVLQNPGRFPEARARRLRPWLTRLVTAIAPHGESLTVRFTGEHAVRRLNRDFRGKDATTDVLSFPGDETPEGLHLGDVVIAVPVARRQAVAADHSPEREIRRLILHGLLHCLGYDHATDDGEMERVERRLAREWLDRG